MTSKITEAVAELTKTAGERVDQIAADHEDLRARVESLMAADDRPTKPGEKTTRPYRVLETKDGPAVELIKGQRFQDVPEVCGESEGPGLARILGAMALGENCGDREAIEAASELKNTSSGTSGITLRNTVAAEWVDLVRAQSIAMQAGARTLSMPTQTYSYIAVTADPTASWRSSEGASLSATDPTFAARTLTAKTIAARTQLTLEAAMDVPDAGEQIARTHAGAMAAALDAAVFIGSSPAPTGLQNNVSVPKVTSVGTPTNYDEILDGVETFLTNDNALESLSAICWHPAIWRVYQGLKTGISSDNTTLALPPALENVPFLVSTNADDQTSPESWHITLGNFSDLLVGMRLEPTVRILDDTTSFASNLLIEIVGVMRADVVALRPNSFVVLEDVAR